ncbi:MAG TPA: PHP domain-containing protein [Desulfobacteraceae bacterium]|nr:PHP domain-containing protein [Desulfobacteraceae bacterium]
MENFIRNKTVWIWKDRDMVIVHGDLDDDIYALEIEIEIDEDRNIISDIKAKWIREENSQCFRAIPPLREIIGSGIEPGSIEAIYRRLSRSSCRHFANLIKEGLFSYLISKRYGYLKEKRGGGTKVEVSERDGRFERSIARRDEAGEFASIIDLHIHTYPRSKCSVMSVEEAIKEAKRIGLNGICLTEHQVMWKREEVEELIERYGLLVLRGVEITTDQGDMLVFGMELEAEEIMKIERLRDIVLKGGGFMIACHPFRGFLTFGLKELGITVESALKRPIIQNADAVEVLNSRVTDDENRFALEVAKKADRLITGGSDAHDIGSVGRYATAFKDPIRTEEDLIQALKSGRYNPIVFK